MAALNKVLLIGNLTQDPELRRIASGTAVSTLRVAVNESFQNKSGEKVERTVFVDVDVWDRQAENCAQYLSKGSPLFVEGRLQLDSWEDKETGQKRSRLKVRADRVQFLSGPRREGAGTGPMSDTPPARDTPQGGRSSTSEPSFDEPLSKPSDDEEIPF
ncbi:MAG: single-stranded DNA-binding protein [Kiritimatiellia bacterium]|jgi:single-strand DNA-binding protein|nr:single-stranded DNA-binding protein [Kiritimatiellia bacterium]